MTGTRTADGTTAMLAGPLGTAICTTRALDGALISCSERFANVPVDRNAVAQLAAMMDPGAQAERVAVADRFISEPIGVVEAGDTLPASARAAVCSADADCAAGVRCRVEVGTLGICDTPDDTAGDGGACGAPCSAGQECEIDAATGRGTCVARGGRDR
jgi:hypothetical protein